MGISIFVPAPVWPGEESRNRAVEQSGLLKKHRDPGLIDICSRLKQTLRVDWAGVSIIYRDSQYVMASSGGMLGEYRRSTSLSAHVVAYPETVFYLLNASADERFAGSSFVDNGWISFFAGAAIFAGTQFALGALCLTCRTPRTAFDERSQQALIDAAASIH
ncbi:hypothetical protein SAMN05192583_3155 [Sphingomonas gellani]|uniref:Uncharacterized protein n=1 Tax=Sphingomonas gellani TaxID=1166340 RepID=A0A1H8HYH6_9SPHN|nr:hypothetical protein [Sphingomonas gellani]SEN61480.1 hypothetical protein SAMN05192583_3155 [Sphingomonas gellani]